MQKISQAMLMTGLFFGSLAMPGLASAQVATNFLLDEIVVTATRTPIDLFNANANISVVTKQDIATRHYQNLREALKEVPGVSFQNYGAAGYSLSDAIYINGTSKVLLLVDGIRMSQGSENNMYDLLNDMDNIERIEVVRGSASSLYGADAQGGVINVITNRNPGYQSKLSLAAGSGDLLNMGIATQGSENNWVYRFAATKNKYGDGEDGHGNDIIQDNDARNLNFMVGKRLGTDGDKGQITIAYDRNKTAFEYMNQYNMNAGKIEKGDSELESYRLIFDYNFDDTLTNKLSVYRNERYMWSPNSYQQQIWSFGVNEQITKDFGKHLLTGGIDHHSDKFVNGYLGYGGAYGMNNMNGTRVNNTGFYIQDIYNLTDKLDLTIGGRYDNSSKFDDEFTGNAKLGYDFNNNTNMYLGYGTFFNTPTIYSLYDKDHGNAALNPENGKNYEFGIHHKFDASTTLTAHVFKRETEEKIVYDYVSEKYKNLDADEDAKGYDIRLTKKFSDKWDASAAYTYVKTEAEAGNVNNHGYIPKHTVEVGVDYNLDKFNANLVAKGILDRPGYGYQEDLQSAFFPKDNYWVINLGLNYQASKDVKTFFKVNNLFDEFYAEASNALGMWGGAAEQWWTMPGRTFIVGVEYSF